uniref:Uncharacterized protein n=1 Tax=Rhizophora mucronata TaxID=61149 RepID=A0A2P2IR57_RHIMU
MVYFPLIRDIDNGGYLGEYIVRRWEKESKSNQRLLL